MIRSKWIFGGPHNPQSVTTEPEKPQVPLPVSSADAKKFGLENIGNTCYANSVIQALYFCTPFRELLVQATDSSLLVSDSALLSSLAPAAPPSPAFQQPLLPVRKQTERKVSGTHPSHGKTSTTSDPTPSSSAAVAPIPPSPATLFSALRSLFVHISAQPADKGTLAPKAFIEKLKEVNEVFRSTMQQDAHEFLNYLLNRIVEEIEDEWKKNGKSHNGLPLAEDLSNSVVTLASTPARTSTSNNTNSIKPGTLVHKLFEGTLTSETRCLTCETVSSRDESFLDLSIDIEQNASVTACLRSFSASEMLCQKNKFFCDACCDLQEAEKRMKIKTLPNVLALHLKRFKFQEDSGKYIKLAYRVAFPLQLRLFNTVDDAEDADRLYDLHGIVVHIGNGPHHGHYISIIKTMGTWFVFDDENVYPIQESDITKYYGDSNSGSAYVLYYQAVDIDLPSLGMHVPSPVNTPFPADSDAHVVIGDITGDILTSSPSFQAVPLLPPGLEDNESSDLSDPPFPITPSQSASALLPVVGDEKRLSKPRLEVYDPDSPSTPTASNGIISGRAPSKGKSFFSIRRTPSSSARPTSTSAAGGDNFRQSFATDRPSAVDKDRAKMLPTISPAGDGEDTPIPATMPPPSPVKDKGPERKNSNWFKRRSFNRKVASEAGDIPPSPVVSVSHADPILVSPSISGGSTSWFRTTGHSGHSPRPSRASQDGHTLLDTGSLAPSSHYDEPVDGDRYSPGAASASSSSMGSAAPIPQQSPNLGSHIPNVLEVVPPRTSSLAAAPHAEQPVPGPHTVTRPPEHKKSFSSLVQKTFSTSSSASAPSVPPIPAMPAGLSSRPLPLTPDADPAPEPEPEPPNHFDKLIPMSNGIDLEAPLPPTPTPKYPIVIFPAATDQHATPPITNSKRASRKLSMTSPILGGLGFGRKEKKDKDKATKNPPVSFATASRS